MRCKYSKFSNCANQNKIFFLFSNQAIAILQDLKIYYKEKNFCFDLRNSKIYYICRALNDPIIIL